MSDCDDCVQAAEDAESFYRASVSALNSAVALG